jgi:hypothetical protein
MDTTTNDIFAAAASRTADPLDIVGRALPTVYCAADKDPPGRPGWNPTVSFWCPLCKHRHTHGNPFKRTQPGERVGTRAAHCDSDGPRLGAYELVIGKERWRPARRRKQRAAPVLA